MMENPAACKLTGFGAKVRLETYRFDGNPPEVFLPLVLWSVQIRHEKGAGKLNSSHVTNLTLSNYVASSHFIFVVITFFIILSFRKSATIISCPFTSSVVTAYDFPISIAGLLRCIISLAYISLACQYLFFLNSLILFLPHRDRMEFRYLSLHQWQHLR
jgi:hypothetical protein